MIKAHEVLSLVFSTRSVGGGRIAPSAGTRSAVAVIAALLMFPASVDAATPIARINYQGVLRNASDAPLDGDSAVYLEVTVNTQVPSPRSLILSAATALNSDRLDGKGPADFIDTSATPQTKAGQLTCSNGVYATSTGSGGAKGYASSGVERANPLPCP